MKTYSLEITEQMGNTSPIDTITAPEGYTAEQYIKDCESNADPEWVEMLNNAVSVKLVEVE